MVREHSLIVKEQFEAEYEEYDKNVRDVLPSYEEMNNKVVEEVKVKGERLEILDLGIGTGQTAKGLLEKYPKSIVTGIDLSPKMLEMAKNRLIKFSNRLKFIEADIIDFEPSQKYDACVAVLSVHHLNQKEKQQLFSRIFNSLNEKGIFVIGDMIIGDSEKETNQIEVEWEEHLIKKLGKKEAENWMKIYRKEDIPDSINNQLRWLKDAGFKEVKCSWNKLNCAVFFGRR
jgi:tRNA (cmo5U34)-methyltransferase